MFILKIFQIIISIVIIYFSFSELIIPGIKGTKIFPSFRSRNSNMTKEFIDVKDDIEYNRKKEELNNLKTQSQSKGDSK